MNTETAVQSRRNELEALALAESPAGDPRRMNDEDFSDFEDGINDCHAGKRERRNGSPAYRAGYAEGLEAFGF